MRSGLEDNDSNALKKLVLETRQGIAKRFERDIFPEFFGSREFQEYVKQRMGSSLNDPIGKFMFDIEVPTEKWEQLRPLLVEYRKAALIRDNNPVKAIAATTQMEKTMQAMVKLVPRVKLEPALRKAGMTYRPPVRVDADKVIRALHVQDANTGDKLRLLIDKFNKSGVNETDRRNAVLKMAELLKRDGGDIYEELIKAKK